ncbi:MAG TPA: TadE family protein [Kribbella sp.]
MRTTERRRCRSERGSMAVEIVLLAPVMMAFMMLVVAGGRYVSVRGDIEAASRDAVRAATLERTESAAQAAVVDIATASLQDVGACQTPRLDGLFESGGMLTVTISCEVSYDGLGLIGLPGSKTVTISSSAPIDLYRRTG